MRDGMVYKNPSFRKLRAGILDIAVSEILPIVHLLRGQKSVVFDVGANIGLWSIALLYCAADQIGSLDLFEPGPESVDRIHQLMTDGYFAQEGIAVKTNLAAVGAAPGTATMYYDESRSDLNTLTGNFTQLPRETVQLTKSREVEVMSIDAYCEANRIGMVDFIKVDTEGFELDVLEGARGMMARKKIRNICFEFGLNQIRRKHFFRDFWDLFAEHGYQIALLPRRREPGMAYNLVKIPQYTTAWERFDGNRYFLASTVHDVPPFR